MYALFVNMYDNPYYMLAQEIKAICAWCCTGLRCERAVREILSLRRRKSDGTRGRGLCPPN